MLTLNQFLERCKEITNQGYEVWIEGLGDGRWKLVVEGCSIGEEERKHIRVEKRKDGTTNA